MDEAELFRLVQQLEKICKKLCKNLKFRFRGIFAANNFPKTMTNESFMIAIAYNPNHAITHWTLRFRIHKNYHFADPLELLLDFSKNSSNISIQRNFWKCNEGQEFKT